MQPEQVIGALYAAFGRGDIPAVLALVAPDVDWEYGGSTAEVPWLQRRQGLAGAKAFFESLAAMRIEHFAVKAVLPAPGFVIGVIDISFTVLATGKRVDEVDEAHVWYLNEAGQISRFRHRADTFLQWRACQPD